MTAFRKWLVKLLTGLAALLLSGLQMLGSLNMPYSAHPYAYGWTDYGMRVLIEEQQQAARLEGEVREESIRVEAMRSEREDRTKAASG